MSTLLKTYRVRFCVRDFYAIELKARDADEAEQIAHDLYDHFGEERFELDLSDGGTEDWDVEEVLP